MGRDPARNRHRGNLTSETDADPAWGRYYGTKAPERQDNDRWPERAPGRTDGPRAAGWHGYNDDTDGDSE